MEHRAQGRLRTAYGMASAALPAGKAAAVEQPSREMQAPVPGEVATAAPGSVCARTDPTRFE